MKIFIPFNTPSLKNSKVATKRGVFRSKTVSRYLQKIGVKKYGKGGFENYKTRPNLFNECVEPLKKRLVPECYPVKLGLHFVRDSKRQFDFINACQIVFDLLVAHGVLPDDNMDYLIPIPLSMDGKFYSVDKVNPGVWVEVL
jgi:hypothetical protein